MLVFEIAQDDQTWEIESMNLQDRVVLNPDVLAGKPVIRGTRLAVEFIVDLLGQGWTEPQVLENYPGIAH